MKPWLKLKFFETSRNPNLDIHECIQCIKMFLSHRFEIVVSKLFYLEISLIVSRLPFSSLQSSTMDPWTKLNFPKYPDFRTWNFLNVFRVSKFRLSPIFGIIKSKVVHSEISFIVTKLSLHLLKVLYYGALAKTQVFKTSRNHNSDIRECIQRIKMSSFTQI